MTEQPPRKHHVGPIDGLTPDQLRQLGRELYDKITEQEAPAMDPNAALAELRAFVSQEDAIGNDLNEQDLRDTALRVLELFDSLDRWLTQSGYLPDAWASGRSV